MEIAGINIEGNNSKKGNMKLGAIMLVAIFCIVTIFGSMATIPAGHKGVLMSFGKVEDRILPEGMSFITPFVNNVAVMTVQTERYSSIASSASKDLQDVSTEVTLNYKLDALRVNEIYRNLQNDYENRVIQPAILESVKASTAQFTAEELITKRPVVKESIEKVVRERLQIYGILMETVSITEFKFSPSFSEAIESKVTAEQLALKAENDLKRITVEAQQKVAQANGEAEATLTKAKAEAEAIKITGEALKNNPQLVTLETVKKWNGVMPVTVITSGQTPQLLMPINGVV